MLILASGSPRRAEILTMLGLEFVQAPANADENVPPGTPPAETVLLLAEKKAEVIRDLYPRDIILTADTVMFLSGEILNKPSSPEHARAMLNTLSGVTHEVYTGVCLLSPKGERLFYERAFVTFYPLSPDEIEEYVRTGEPMDKAGAYGIQGR